MNRRNAVRSLLLTGVAGPCIFAAAVIIGGALRADYSHVDQFMSELGESGSHFAWVMNYFGFMLTASLILIFVFTFRTQFPKTLTNTLGTLFLAIFAVSLFLAGVYSCDVGCPAINRTQEQRLHDVFSIVAFPAFILGVVTWGISFYRNSDWKKFGIYSLVTAVGSIFLLVAMVQSEPTRDGTGTYQRLFLGVLFLWLMTLAIRLRGYFAIDEST